MKYLIDTNVISELWKPRPEAKVEAFIADHEWFIPVPVICEIQEGAEATPSQARRLQLNERLSQLVEDYADVIVDWDRHTARIWGRLRHSEEVRNKPQALWDSLIDALAVQHDAVVITRNQNDFRHARTVNPWAV